MIAIGRHLHDNVLISFISKSLYVSVVVSLYLLPPSTELSLENFGKSVDIFTSSENMTLQRTVLKYFRYNST